MVPGRTIWILEVSAVTKRPKSESASESQVKHGASGAKRLPRGFGAMRDVVLDLDPRIDLTKPIYEQVLALDKTGRAAAE